MWDENFNNNLWNTVQTPSGIEDFIKTANEILHELDRIKNVQSLKNYSENINKKFIIG